ncbi:MAG TPA: hypothetical protein VEF89_30900 [Solirubrobacteraceae bacterium]|nr:hypothetical protein [Solirubrobacteraceae bacterium]
MNEQPTLRLPAGPPSGRPDDLIIPVPAGWPAPPNPAVYHGLPGAIVAQIAPHTEADPVAILTQLLVACGALIGRGAHFRVEATLHHPNEFLLLIGDSARARKGGSYDHVTRLLAEADPALPSRLRTGLASGEGLVWAVRDPDGQDPGVSDKRLLIAEPEFASVLKQTQRDINTLSPVLRSAWDGRPLALLTRTAPARATSAHISIIGHITQTELHRHATTVELANGFLNRFVLAMVRRVRLLPEGGDPEPLKDTGLVRYLASVLKHAHTAGRVKLDDAARELWWQTYPQLTHPGDGLTGHLTARAEAHTIRLALLYALLDGERRIQPEHLQAALALWDFAARSATWAFGQATGDPLAEQIHAALVRSPNGLTRTQISHLLHRNLPAHQLTRALHVLAATGRAQQQKILTAGRPTELWTACPQPPRTS